MDALPDEILSNVLLPALDPFDLVPPLFTSRRLRKLLTVDFTPAGAKLFIAAKESLGLVYLGTGLEYARFCCSHGYASLLRWARNEWSRPPSFDPYAFFLAVTCGSATSADILSLLI